MRTTLASENIKHPLRSRVRRQPPSAFRCFRYDIKFTIIPTHERLLPRGVLACANKDEQVTELALALHTNCGRPSTQ
ncbi:hypothetical protein PanWU01x14_191770 [Parasponia andersonii]|uniref:Uncharacterized protein n=1 Tax=Parasponia andersonii TaxID=3476 RepID=A0A2P5C1N2_PARAD|nr:hypothetical protein PanWU01x14_191770 [Parasponia andersonii]